MKIVLDILSTLIALFAFAPLASGFQWTLGTDDDFSILLSLGLTALLITSIWT